MNVLVQLKISLAKIPGGLSHQFGWSLGTKHKQAPHFRLLLNVFILPLMASIQAKQITGHNWKQKFVPEFHAHSPLTSNRCMPAIAGYWNCSSNCATLCLEEDLQAHNVLFVQVTSCSSTSDPVRSSPILFVHLLSCSFISYPVRPPPILFVHLLSCSFISCPVRPDCTLPSL